MFKFLISILCLQATCGLQFYKPLFCNNKWIPENMDEKKGFETYQNDNTKYFNKCKICNKNKKKTKKTKQYNKEKINKNENIFNQEGELPIID